MSSIVDLSSALLLVLASAATGAPMTDPLPAGHALSNQSAEGPYLFSETAWLAALHSCNRRATGVPEAARVFRTSNGRYYIPLAAERRDILKLRQQPDTAKAIASCYARHNSDVLSRTLKRTATPGELYAAHVLGPDAAIALLKANDARPRSRPDGDLARALVETAGTAMNRTAPISAWHRRFVGEVDLAAEATVAAHVAANVATAGMKGPLAEGLLTIGGPLARAVAGQETAVKAVAAID